MWRGKNYEKEASLKAVATKINIGKIIIPVILIGVLTVLILLLNVCMREKKR